MKLSIILLTYSIISNYSTAATTLKSQFGFEGNVIRDVPISHSALLERYPIVEREHIKQDVNLLNALNSAYSFSTTFTHTIHKTITYEFSIINGPVKQQAFRTENFKKLPSNVQRIIRMLPENDFDYLFPVRRTFYSYMNFIKAASKWPRFCGEMNKSHPLIDTRYISTAMDQACAAELASLFAHFTQEVGAHSGKMEAWREGLYYVEEIGCENNACPQYNTPCNDGNWTQYAFPCTANVTYHGRGAKQLSYNYNYGTFSRVMINDFSLLHHPDRITQNGYLAFASAIYFFMTPRSPKPSIHQTITGLWQPTPNDVSAHRQLGFGVQTLIVNGRIECGTGELVPQAKNRSHYFIKFATFLNVFDAVFKDTQLDCINSLPFTTTNGSKTFYKGFIAKKSQSTCDYVYWEETGFSAFIPGDLGLCVQSLKENSYPGFPSTWINKKS